MGGAGGHQQLQFQSIVLKKARRWTHGNAEERENAEDCRCYHGRVAVHGASPGRVICPGERNRICHLFNCFENDGIGLVASHPAVTVTVPCGTLSLLDGREWVSSRTKGG